jgi:hypothetical protein
MFNITVFNIHISNGPKYTFSRDPLSGGQYLVAQKKFMVHWLSFWAMSEMEACSKVEYDCSLVHKIMKLTSYLPLRSNKCLLIPIAMSVLVHRLKISPFHNQPDIHVYTVYCFCSLNHYKCQHSDIVRCSVFLKRIKLFFWFITEALKGAHCNI